MPKTTQTKRLSPFASRDKRIAELEAKLATIEKEDRKGGIYPTVLNGTEVTQVAVNTLNSEHYYRNRASGLLLIEELSLAMDRHKEEWTSIVVTLLPTD